MNIRREYGRLSITPPNHCFMPLGQMTALVSCNEAHLLNLMCNLLSQDVVCKLSAEHFHTRHKSQCVFSAVPSSQSLLLSIWFSRQALWLYKCMTTSIDHSIHYVDMRKPQAQLQQLKGHRKAVSYVQFISDSEVVSA